MNILITGGAGFIGSHVVRRFLKNYPTYKVINFDKLTYAGNLANLKDVENHPNYAFFKGDICSVEDVTRAFEQHEITHVIHLAAESHVDRSIEGPLEFAMTNVVGTIGNFDRKSVGMIKCIDKMIRRRFGSRIWTTWIVRSLLCK